jgi:hypothetical protein
MSGLAYWSHDVGGFWSDPTPELFVRWSQLGFLSALSRFHGATPREPWCYGQKALRIFPVVRAAPEPARALPGELRWQASGDGALTSTCRAENGPTGGPAPGHVHQTICVTNVG